MLYWYVVFVEQLWNASYVRASAANSNSWMDNEWQWVMSLENYFLSSEHLENIERNSLRSIFYFAGRNIFG